MKHISKNLNKIEKEFPNQSMGINTGFESLNNLLWGFQKQQLIVIGGRPAMGKSSIMCNMMLAASKEKPVGVFSLEMPFELLQARAACNLADVNFKRLQRGKATENELDKFKKALTNIKNYPILIDDSCTLLGLDNYWLKQRGVKVEDTMDYKIEQLAKEGIKVMFVDYLQLITSIKPSNDIRIVVGRMAETLRNYAKQYEICIVLLSQLRRFDQARIKNPTPTMDDLKESGEIENHADVVILLHRPQYYNKQEEINTMLDYRESDAKLIIAKHRNGETGTITAEWLGYAMSFKDLEIKNKF